MLNYYNNKNIHSENFFLKAVKIYVEFYSFLQCIIKVAEKYKIKEGAEKEYGKYFTSI